MARSGEGRERAGSEGETSGLSEKEGILIIGSLLMTSDANPRSRMDCDSLRSPSEKDMKLWSTH